MRKRSNESLGRAGLGVAALLLAGALPASGANAAGGACAAPRTALDTPTPRPSCCFTNTAYTGVCVVQPEKDETCATILAYLNDPRSQGKNYCGSTTLRGGWKSVPCEAPPPPPSEAPSSRSTPHRPN
jgi:hypothetical protein